MKPEQVKLAVTLNDGSIVVMAFVTKSYLPNGNVHFTREASDKNIREELDRFTWGGQVASWRFITDDDLPTDRYFRNAWTDTGTKLDVDMPKAREIHKKQLRFEREPVLAKLDVDYMRADEAKDNKKKQQISEAKQALRDITDLPEIEAAQTPEELKEVGKDLLNNLK